MPIRVTMQALLGAALLATSLNRRGRIPPRRRYAVGASIAPVIDPACTRGAPSLRFIVREGDRRYAVRRAEEPYPPALQRGADRPQVVHHGDAVAALEVLDHRAGHVGRLRQLFLAPPRRRPRYPALHRGEAGLRHSILALTCIPWHFALYSCIKPRRTFGMAKEHTALRQRAAPRDPPAAVPFLWLRWLLPAGMVPLRHPTTKRRHRTKSEGAAAALRPDGGG